MQEELIADVRLIYKELDCLDSPIEVVATTEQVPVPFSATGAMYSRPAFKAVPLQHESGLISLLPREYGGQLAMVPPPGVEARAPDGDHQDCRPPSRKLNLPELLQRTLQVATLPEKEVRRVCG